MAAARHNNIIVLGRLVPDRIRALKRRSPHGSPPQAYGFGADAWAWPGRCAGGPCARPSATRQPRGRRIWCSVSSSSARRTSCGWPTSPTSRTGTVYVAFVVDAYARRILGWRAATNMRTESVLDALEQAIWTRAREGRGDLAGLVSHSDAGGDLPPIELEQAQ
ncbi:MAG: DDE-type integrase/transposase/recombinase [Sporichthyaceae bacterium]